MSARHDHPASMASMRIDSIVADAERIAWYAQAWSQADKEAIADKHSGLNRPAEYWARRQLRAAVNDTVRRTARSIDGVLRRTARSRL